MATLDILRPSNLAAFSLSRDGHFNNAIPGNHYQLILIIIERRRSETYGDGDCHPWSDVPRSFVGVFDAGQGKFFLLERCDFDPLDIFRIIDEFDF